MRSSVALVLGAGRGERMGGAKALMRINNEAWWRVQQRRLADAGVDAVWVVSREVDRALGAEADAPAGRVLADPDAPMFASVLAGILSLAGAPPAGVFVLPVDVPAARADVWRALAAEAAPSVPVSAGKRGHPIHLPWGWIETTLLPAAANAPPASLRLDRLLAGWATGVKVDDHSVTVNLNTPADALHWAQRGRP